MASASTASNALILDSAIANSRSESSSTDPDRPPPNYCLIVLFEQNKENNRLKIIER